MKASVAKRYDKLKEIIQPCRNFDCSYESRSYDEETAKKALVSFFLEFEKLEPEKKLRLGNRKNYYSFIINILPFRRALHKKFYAVACHELLTLYHYEPILQPRIYHSLLSLFHSELKEISDVQKIKNEKASSTSE